MITHTRGRLIYATSKLAALLGYDPREIEGLDFSRLMAQPFAQLHGRWMDVSVHACVCLCVCVYTCVCCVRGRGSAGRLVAQPFAQLHGRWMDVSI